MIRDYFEDKGISPVIGVILMVVVTVVMAAVIFNFVIGVGDNVDTSQGSDIAVNFEQQEDSVRATLNKAGTSGELRVNGTRVANFSAGDAGRTYELTNLNEDSVVSVIRNDSGDAVQLYSPASEVGNPADAAKVKNKGGGGNNNLVEFKLDDSNFDTSEAYFRQSRKGSVLIDNKHMTPKHTSQVGIFTEITPSMSHNDFVSMHNLDNDDMLVVTQDDYDNYKDYSISRVDLDFPISEVWHTEISKELVDYHHPEFYNDDGKIFVLAETGSSDPMIYALDKSTGSITLNSSKTDNGGEKILAIDKSNDRLFFNNNIYDYSGSKIGTYSDKNDKDISYDSNYLYRVVGSSGNLDIVREDLSSGSVEKVTDLPSTL